MEEKIIEFERELKKLLFEFNAELQAEEIGRRDYVPGSFEIVLYIDGIEAKNLGTHIDKE